MSLLRTSTGLIHGLTGIRGRTVNQGATANHAAACQTCGKLADEELCLDVYPSQFVRVLVRHHGAEELHTFDLGTGNFADQKDWCDQLDQHLRNWTWFRPETKADSEMRVAGRMPSHDPEIPSGKIIL